jgi:hypothetical protein
MGVGLQESDTLWPVVPRFTSPIMKAFASEDKVSRVHIASSSGSEQDNDDNDGRSKVDEDKTLRERCEGASIQAVDHPNDDKNAGHKANGHALSHLEPFLGDGNSSPDHGRTPISSRGYASDLSDGV